MTQEPFTQELEISGAHLTYENMLEGQKKKTIEQKHFVVCESCATLIEVSDADANIPCCNKCPTCHEYRITIIGL